MAYPMRRKQQQLTEAQCRDILRAGSSGVLALVGADGAPYAVPLSYLWEEGRVYFHCAKSGRKMDAIRHCDRASFCVVGQDRVVPEEYTTYYRSVILSGRLRVLEDPQEVRTAICALARKYHPTDTVEHRDRLIEKEWPALCVVEMTIEEMTGKQARELMEHPQ